MQRLIIDWHFCEWQEKIKSLLGDIGEFKPHMEYIMRSPLLFGDYRNALDIGEPRIYEDMQDYEAAKAIFEQVRFLEEATLKQQANKQAFFFFSPDPGRV